MQHMLCDNNDPFKSVYDKLNIFRDTLSDTVEDLGETSVEIIHGQGSQSLSCILVQREKIASLFDTVVGVTGQAYKHVIKPGAKKVGQAVATTVAVAHGTFIRPFFRGVGNGIDSVIDNR